MFDFYISCPSKEVLIQELSQFEGLVVKDEDGSDVLAQASHKHALCYLGKLVKTNGTMDAEGKVLTEAVFYDGEHCNLRVLDEALENAIKGATFGNGVTLLTPATPCVVWA